MQRTFAKLICAAPVFITLHSIDGLTTTASPFVSFCYGFVADALGYDIEFDEFEEKYG